MKRTTIAGICLLAIAFAAGFSLSTFHSPAHAGEYGAFVSQQLAFGGCPNTVCISNSCEGGGEGMICEEDGGDCVTNWCEAPM